MYKPAALLLSFAFMVLSLTAQSAELAGVKMPDTEKVDGQTLVLNGMGLREATFLKIDVYVIGLYLSEKQSDAEAILHSTSNKRVVMHFVRDVDKEKLNEGWLKGLKRSPDAAQISAEIKQFIGTQKDMQKGQQLVFDFAADGVRVKVAGNKAAVIHGAGFYNALLNVWLAAKVPEEIEPLKAGMLGQ
ncbi:MAG: chalcone isomerase family protein [gamma proteobacterium symbiont of Bathyaustriella thionipta]|nr:chalcone isomerase family protein [gamma proteobacterium symbiont of Bathyaustriella thionipta]